MSLLSKPRDVVAAMSKDRRTAYFEQYAGYFPDSPDKCYAIRVGSTTLQARDTMDLRRMFDHFVRYGTVRDFGGEDE